MNPRLTFIFCSLILLSLACQLLSSAEDTEVPPTGAPTSTGLPHTDTLTSTSPPPTDTPPPPTAPPADACALVCEVDVETYTIEITCETGPMTIERKGESTSYDYDSAGNQSEIRLTLNRNRIYENTQNEYSISGYIEVDLVQNSVDYEILVTGGEFGTAPQICAP